MMTESKDDESSSSSLIQQQEQQQLIRLPVRAQFWLNIPYISASNIYSNFTDDESLDSIIYGVTKLIHDHPMLVGKIIRRKPTEDETTKQQQQEECHGDGDDDEPFLCPKTGTIVEIISNQFTFKDVFKIVDHTTNNCGVLLPNLTKALYSDNFSKIDDAQNAAREELEPLFQDYSLKPLRPFVNEENQPLFQVVVGKLPNNRAYVLIEVAHVIADGSSYYNIYEELNNNIILGGGKIMLKEENDNNNDDDDPSSTSSTPTPLIFTEVPHRHIHNPEHRSERDIYRSLQGWLPTCIDALQTRKHCKTSFTVKKDILDEMKVSLAKDAGVPFLSTNDVLMYSLAEIYHNNTNHHDVMMMPTDMRGRHPTANKYHMGNFHRNIFFPTKCLLDDPAFIRRNILQPNTNANDNTIIQFDYYGTDQFPDLSTNLFGAVTNWAGITKFVHPKGARLDIHLPNSKFLVDHGFDITLIWKPTTRNDNISIMTNICEDTLKNNAKTSKLFKTLFLFDL